VTRRAWLATPSGLGRTVALSALAAALVGVAAAPARASSEPLAACTATSGVILAVDFGPWGGPLLRSCGSTPTTGYALLNQGGWRTTGTIHDGPAFICRIGYSGYAGATQYPTTATEACVVTPPATAYWSYWHADPGQHTWTYSQVGPASYQPPPGSVELWTFGGTSGSGGHGAPTVSPDALRAAPVRPTHSAAPSPAGTHSGGHQASTTSRAPAPAAGLAPASAQSRPAATATRPVAAAGGSPAPAQLAGTVVDAQPAAAAAAAGSPVAAIVALALVALLASAGAVIRWRRRADRS
jgi:hypothetical protein